MTTPMSNTTKTKASKHLFSSPLILLIQQGGGGAGKQKASSLLLARTTVSSSDVTAKAAWTMVEERALRTDPLPAKVTKLGLQAKETHKVK